MVTISTVQ